MSAIETDFYELLGIERAADGATIKAAYRKLAMQHHPDRNAGCKDNEDKFKAISAAYECLKDPQKRAAYDRFGHAAFTQGMGNGSQADFGDLGDIFETIFGSAFGGGARSRPRRGADMRYDLEIGLEDAFRGKTTEIKVEVSVTCEPCAGSGATPGTTRRGCELCHGRGKVRAHQGLFVIERPCPNCHGSGQVIEQPCRECRGEGRVDKVQTMKVEVPAGVDNGTRIRLNGKGEAGPIGAPPGDLYIFVHIKAHPVFQREGNALFTHVPVSFTTAALGGTIVIPGLDGQKHSIDIPAGIQTGRQLRQRGAGMPVLQGRGVGDLVVEIQVETPIKLNSRQRELLEEFRKLETGDECPASKKFFRKLKGLWDG